MKDETLASKNNHQFENGGRASSFDVGARFLYSSSKSAMVEHRIKGVLEHVKRHVCYQELLCELATGNTTMLAIIIERSSDSYYTCVRLVIDVLLYNVNFSFFQKLYGIII